jgi:hypothetical protein
MWKYDNIADRHHRQLFGLELFLGLAHSTPPPVRLPAMYSRT